MQVTSGSTIQQKREAEAGTVVSISVLAATRSGKHCGFGLHTLWLTQINCSLQMLGSICRSLIGTQLSRAFSTTSTNTISKRLSVCVVGSGPAGFYTVDKVWPARTVLSGRRT